MTTKIWVKIPNLSKYKINQVPLMIGKTQYGEVTKILRSAPGDQYEVEATVFPAKRDEFIKLVANMR